MCYGPVLIPAATTTATTEVATRGATITLLGFVDLQRTTAEVLAIERLHGAGGIGIRHFDETKTAWAAGLAIVHQGHLVDGAMGGKEGAHLVFGGGERKISNVKFRHKTTHKKRNTVTGSQPCRLLVREYFGGADTRECGVVSTKESEPRRKVQETSVRRDFFSRKLASPGARTPNGARAGPISLLINAIRLMQLAADLATRPFAGVDVGVGRAIPHGRHDLRERGRLDALAGGADDVVRGDDTGYLGRAYRAGLW